MVKVLWPHGTIDTGDPDIVNRTGWRCPACKAAIAAHFHSNTSLSVLAAHCCACKVITIEPLFGIDPPPNPNLLDLTQWLRQVTGELRPRIAPPPTGAPPA